MTPTNGSFDWSNHVRFFEQPVVDANRMSSRSFRIGAAVLVAAFATAVSMLAFTTNFGPVYSVINGPDTRSVTLNVNSTISGAATLSVTFMGDFSFPQTEQLDIAIDGVNVATLGTPNADCVVDSATINILAATLAPLIADGQIVLSFSSTGGVNNFCSGAAPFSGSNFAFGVEGTLTYTAASPSQPSAPSWTLASTPSPTAFSAAGQVVTYGHALTNTGAVAIDAISVTGTNMGPIACLANSLAAGASTTCTSSYTTTAADVGNPIAFSATATGTAAVGTLPAATHSGTVAFTASPILTLWSGSSPTTFGRVGEAIAYGYTVTNTGNVSISAVSVVGVSTGTISCAASTLAAGTATSCTSVYTTTAADMGRDISFRATATGTPAGGTLTTARWNGTVAYAPRPKLTISAIPSPTTFGQAGAAIAYGYQVTNSGNGPVSAIVLTGTKTGTIGCLATTLPVGAVTTCASTYTTTVDDLGADIAFSVAGTGTPDAGALAVATFNGAITFIARPALTLVVTTSPKTFSRVEQAIGFSYQVSNSGNVVMTSTMVTDNRITGITCPVTTLAAGAGATCSGVYTTTSRDVFAGHVIGTATATGLFGTTTIASAGVTTDLQLDVEAVRRATQSAIHNFMNHRADMIVSTTPSMSAMHERLTGWLGGAGDDRASASPDTGLTTFNDARVEADDVEPRAADTSLRSPSDRTRANPGSLMTTMPFQVNGAGNADIGRFSFALNRAQLSNAFRSAQTGPARAGATASPLLWNIWAEGAASWFGHDVAETSYDADGGVTYVGADRRVSTAVLVGGLVQFDWMSERASVVDVSASGHGWMAGPYISLRPARDLFVDARVAWGGSANHVNPLGIYSDEFSTGRSLVSAKATGRWTRGAFHSRPNAEVIYFRETQADYSDRLGIMIPDQSVSFGRLTFGPEIGYPIELRSKLRLEPYVGVNGVWDFARSADMTLIGLEARNDRLRARVEFGATARSASGLAFSASVSRDGIGSSSFHANRMRVWIAVPID